MAGRCGVSSTVRSIDDERRGEERRGEAVNDDEI